MAMKDCNLKCRLNTLFEEYVEWGFISRDSRWEKNLSKRIAALNILVYDVINLFDLLTLNRQTKIILH